MLINNLLSLFGLDSRPLERQEFTKAVETEKVCENTTGIFDNDIKALTEKFGNLSKLGNIEVTLQELLSICPRKRQRSDAYKGLICFLQTNYSLSLTIKSRKPR